MGVTVQNLEKRGILNDPYVISFPHKQWIDNVREKLECNPILQSDQGCVTHPWSDVRNNWQLFCYFYFYMIQGRIGPSDFRLNSQGSEGNDNYCVQKNKRGMTRWIRLNLIAFFYNKSLFLRLREFSLLSASRHVKLT